MTAQVWAAAVRRDKSVSWRGLEVAAFEAHPRSQRMLDPKGKYHRAQRHPAKTLLIYVAAIPAALVLIALLLGPVCGLAALAVGRNESVARQFDPLGAVHSAGIILAVYVAAWLIPIVVLWWRSGRKDPEDRKSGAFSSLNAGIAFLGGAACSAVAAYHGAASAVPNWPLWSVPMYAATGIGAGFAVAIFAVHHRTPRPTPEQEQQRRASAQDAATSKRFNRIQNRIRRLPAAEQASVRHDIDAAIRDLAARDVISADDREWALGADLGRLALHMSQPRKPPPPDKPTHR